MKLEPKNHKEVFVTGGGGLIGSFLSEILVNKGHRVFIIDDFSKGHIKNLKNIENKVEIIEADLQDISQARNALSQAKNIFHLASRAYGIGYSSKNHIETLLHNEKITNNLLEVFTESKPENILITSSSCVYKDGGPDTISERDLFEENPEEANKGYGWAKRFLEQKFILFSEINEVNLKIVRPFNIYGERYRWVGEYSSAIPMLIKRILDGEDPLYAWGSGNQRRSYMHAYDCARLMIKIMDNTIGNVVVNIGTRETISVSELVSKICNISGNNPKIIFDTSKPEGRFVKSSDTDHLQKIINSEKITTIEIDEGLKKMIGWYNENFK
ncbi:MAG: NAD-dependent epimerase/dehydratase family protein [Prochlorococcus marinus CUG1438]|nr:NAD-dependent epimerase/dehydratase family protein [Prochlorococcus marinus CUG1438]